MNRLSKKLHSIKRVFGIKKQFLIEAIGFYQSLSRHNASIHTDDSISKMQYTLLRENHVIEKGLSMRNPRKGFGQQKVLALLGRLKKYIKLYAEKDNAFLEYPLSTIASYIEYTKRQGIEIPVIEKEYTALLASTKQKEIKAHYGIKEIQKDFLLRECKKDFASLLYNRHSIRYFSKAEISTKLLNEALTLAQQTPSACNRQGWLTHIFLGKESIRLIQWQGGANGFEYEISCSILVTANLNAFLHYEVHQAYVDGGLYAMNLINALSSLGLGTIPLSCGFRIQKTVTLYKEFAIPENEVPILIIGVGHLPDTFKVAVSTRKKIAITNTYHSSL